VDGVDKALATHASLRDRYLEALKHYDDADAVQGKASGLVRSVSFFRLGAAA